MKTSLCEEEHTSKQKKKSRARSEDEENQAHPQSFVQRFGLTIRLIVGPRWGAHPTVAYPNDHSPLWNRGRWHGFPLVELWHTAKKQW